MKIMNYLLVKTKKCGKFKLKTPKDNWLDEFTCLRSKAFSFICNGGNTNKIGEISKSCSKTNSI